MKSDLSGQALGLYNSLPQDLQEEYWRLQADREKARELADMVGSVIVDESLRVEILGMVADCLKEDLAQIKQAAVEILEEERATRELWQTEGKEGQQWQEAGRKNTP